MFGSRRHKVHNPPLTAATANPNAATAAAAVFKRRQSSPSLSAAAAAAALRARPITPTNVADVQTKRTQRRSASVSSTGTEPDARRRPALQRRGSSGSMTERSFRSPSSNRSESGQGRSQGHTISAPVVAPPVPALPNNLETTRTTSSRIRSGGSAQQSPKQHRRATSLGIVTTPVRVASQKLGQDETPSWFGAARVGDAGNVRRIDPAMASPPSSPPQEEISPEDGRPGSTASVNFSYPARMRLGSPPVSPVEGQSANTILIPLRSARQKEKTEKETRPEQRTTVERRSDRISTEAGSSARVRPTSSQADQSVVYDPNSRRIISRSELLAVERSVIDASEAPTKSSNKKKQTPQRTGSHLSRGTMGRVKEDIPAAVRAEEEEDVQPTSVPASVQRPTTAEVPSSAHNKPSVSRDEPSVQFTTTSPVAEANRAEQRSRPQQVSTDTIAVGEAGGRAAQSVPSTTIGSSEQTVEQPSVAQEERLPASEEPKRQAVSPRSISGAIDAVPTREKREPVIAEPARSKAQTDVAAPQSASRLGESPVMKPELAPHASTMTNDQLPMPSGPKAAEDIRHERAHSNSPARQAHFAPMQSNLIVRHSPPPRSISPRKSAMKQQSPNRGASPPDDISEASNGAIARDEASAPRTRKSVRVSFDDEHTVVVGESASAADQEGDPSVPLSPQNASVRRPWYSNITRARKKDFVPLDDDDDDDDEVMKPRPALPSFGSVRDRKPRERSPEEEERPLVRPTAETIYSPPPWTSRSNVTDNTRGVLDDPRLDSEQRLGQSSDHAIGALLLLSKGQEEQDFGSGANRTRRFGEPLPPVVTSIEGSGYASDTTSSSSSSESEDQVHDTELSIPFASASDEAQTTRARAPERVPNESTRTTRIPETEQAGMSVKAEKDDENEREDEGTFESGVPTISISEASPLRRPSTSSAASAASAPFPAAEPEQKPSAVYFDVPGGFPEDESDVSGAEASSSRPTSPAATQVQAATQAPAEPTRAVILEPVSQGDDALPAPHTLHTPQTAFASQAPVTEGSESEDGSETSVYSDAYEDLSDLEGNGFLSLDAVVESPITPRVAAEESQSKQSPIGQASGRAETSALPPKLDPEVSTATTAVESLAEVDNVPSGEDWERAKAYWRSLTAAKRAQLEREAREDAGIEADLEEAQALSKPRKKKSVERRSSEKKALAVHLAQQMVAQQMVDQRQNKEAARDPERTYMIEPGTRWPRAETSAPPTPTPTPAPASAIMRKSLRDDPRQQKKETAGSNDGPRLRKSMRSSGSENGRTVLPSPAPDARQIQKQQGSKDMGRVQAGFRASQPALRRRGSDSSTSSFRRSNPVSSVGGQGFGFRKSMRQASPSSNNEDAGGSGGGGKRFSLRALSPVRSPFGRPTDSASMMTTSTMRQTLRDSSANTKKSGGLHEPTRRGGKMGGKQASSKRKTLGSKFTSRIGDSSDDEDGGVVSGFHSRFGDSSDDDDTVPAPLPMSTALAKTVRSGASARPAHLQKRSSYGSTALPEEEEEEEEEEVVVVEEEKEKKGMSEEVHDGSVRNHGAHGLASSQTANNGFGFRSPRSGQHGNVAASQTAPVMGLTTGASPTASDGRPSSRHNSLMSVLWRKKQDGGKISRPDVMDSAARRDTPLERSLGELRDIRSPEPPPQSPRPRLQKRFSARAGGDVHAVNDAASFERVNRPSSSGNLGTRTVSGLGIADSAVRSDLLPRRGTTRSESTYSVDVSGGMGDAPEVGAGKKKKKFSALRKMFRLDD